MLSLVFSRCLIFTLLRIKVFIIFIYIMSGEQVCLFACVKIRLLFLSVSFGWMIKKYFKCIRNDGFYLAHVIVKKNLRNFSILCVMPDQSVN